MIYGPVSHTEVYYNRAIELIKSAHQGHKREIEARDEKIRDLERKLEFSQNENYRLNEKENSCYKELISSNQFMEQKLIMEQAKNEELQAENSKIRQDNALYKDKVTALELEKQKADHIIKTLLQKVQLGPKSVSPTNLHPNHHHHTTTLNSRVSM